MTPAEHDAQRDAVRLSLLLADTPEDRHNSYPKSKRINAVPGVVGHRYSIPVIVERERPL